VLVSKRFSFHPYDLRWGGQKAYEICRGATGTGKLVHKLVILITAKPDTMTSYKLRTGLVWDYVLVGWDPIKSSKPLRGREVNTEFR